MATEKPPQRPGARRPRAASLATRRRIPLPSLPAFDGSPAKPAEREGAGDHPIPDPVSRSAETREERNAPVAGGPRPRGDAPPSPGVSHEEADLLIEGAVDDDLAALIEDGTLGQPEPRRRAGAADSGPGARTARSGPAAPARKHPDDGDPERPGSPGAEVLNELVEEIERDLEEEVSRLTLQTHKALPNYRRTLPCSYVPAARRGAARDEGARGDDS